MNIGKQMEKMKAKGWNVEFKTTYLFQERSVQGDYWYTLAERGSLDDAVECEMRHFEKWYGRVFDSIDQVEVLRIVMRHTVEVVL